MLTELEKLENIRAYYISRLDIWASRLAQVGVFNCQTTKMVLDRMATIKSELKDIELDIMQSTKQ